MKKCFTIFLFIYSAELLSNPSGHHVKAGNAAVSYTEGLCEIKTSDRAIIHWEEFSSLPGEIIQFIQPQSSSAVLNRVIGVNPSELMGELKANGQIYLINPNGVLVGVNGRIECASFVGATLDVLDEDFLQGKECVFSGNSESSVSNYGKIIANDVNFFGKFFHHEGTIDALEVEQVNGQVRLIAQEGTGTLKGTIKAPSGTVHLLGEGIVLEEPAEIDVSGLAQGGVVLIGGDCHGTNPEIPNSAFIHVSPNVQIHADALDCGDGGKVILWGNQKNAFFGDVSACGGSSGGNGGFVEISSPGHLEYAGNVSTFAPMGKTGTLLLDPTNILIAAATDPGVSFATPPIVTWTVASNPVNIAAAAIAAALGANNVTIDTTTLPDGGVAGNITVSNAIAWVSTNTLTLNASQDITVNANIQHSNAAIGMGGVVLTASRDITVSAVGAGANVSVGSQNSATSVTAGRNVVVQGGILATRSAQIGFRSGAGQTAAGPITINCVDLSVLAGLLTADAAQIGHGGLTATNILCATSSANITIATTGNFLMQNSVSANSFSMIGHGSLTLGNGAGSNQSGNITINCGGNFTMDGIGGLGIPAPILIGHGQPSGAAALGTGPLNLAGNIDITIGGNWTMQGPGSTQIGHGAQLGGTRTRALTGNINLCCGGDALLNASTFSLRVGHYVPGTAASPLLSVNGNYDISIGGNLTMNAGVAALGSCIIGYIDSAAIVSTTQLTIGLNLSVCGDVNFSVPLPGGSASTMGIGLLANNGASMTKVNMAVGGDWNAVLLKNRFFIGNIIGDFNVAVGGTWTISPQTQRGTIIAGNPGTLRIYTGGSFLADASAGTLQVGRVSAPLYPVLVQAASLDIRAGGDITWPSSYAPALTGPIGMQAGHPFAAGEMWNGAGTSLTSICSQSVVPFDMRCGSCTAFTMPSSPNTPSCGAFSPSASVAVALNFSTPQGLTIHSQCSNCASGVLSSLLIGAAATNDITFGVPIGAVDIGPFYDVDLNQDITSTATVSMTACNNLNVNAGSSITAAGSIILIADVDDSGAGNANLQGGNITSTGGAILIDAGFGAASGTSSVNQTSGTISTNGGSIQIQALYDILIDGNATSVSSGSGPISFEAGHDISILEDLASTTGSISSLAGNDTYVTNANVSTAGSILMITGVDMFLSSASISSTGSHIDLVVDNLFPTAPDIGPGSFNMDGTSVISSLTDYIMVYTALQSQNNIDSGAQFVNAGTPYFFTDGTLYVNSLNEAWCTYYPDGTGGIPFRIFYKDCLQQITVVANEIGSQFLFMYLNTPFDYPGFLETYAITYLANTDVYKNSSYQILDSENYFLRRRNYRFWTLKNIQPAEELPVNGRL